MAKHSYNRAVVNFDKIEKLYSTLGCSFIEGALDSMYTLHFCTSCPTNI